MPWCFHSVKHGMQLMYEMSWGKMGKFLEMILYLDCWPSGRFGVGFIVPPAEQATMILAFLSIFDSTSISVNEMISRLAFELLAFIRILSILPCMKLGFSSVPENIPKNANAARLAMSQAVHSFISLYTCTLIASGGWPCQTFNN